MEAFNELLRLLPFQFDIRGRLEDELPRLSQRDRDRLLVPLPLDRFRLYYPISFYDEFGLAPVDQNFGRPVSPLELLQSIKEIYRAQVPRTTLERYAKDRPESYQDLLTARSVLLSDLVGGRYYIDSLSRFEDGYLLNLIF
jgi:hypothetical protein